MLQLRPAHERGVARLAWLDSRHTFSFGHYFDPRFMGHGPLRVINEDRVRPGQGFDLHGHRDMEIITYVLGGALMHRDSLGNGSEIRPGDVQRMSAGTGVEHSEFNASQTEEVHLLQIWVLPEAKGLAPGYEQRYFAPEQKQRRWCLLTSHTGREGSVRLNRDADLYAALLDGEAELEHHLAAGRQGWLQVARGTLVMNGVALSAGDGLGLTGPLNLRLSGAMQAELLLFDMQ